MARTNIFCFCQARNTVDRGHIDAAHRMRNTTTCPLLFLFCQLFFLATCVLTDDMKLRLQQRCHSAQIRTRKTCLEGTKTPQKSHGIKCCQQDYRSGSMPTKSYIDCSVDTGTVCSSRKSLDGPWEKRHLHEIFDLFRSAMRIQHALPYLALRLIPSNSCSSCTNDPPFLNTLPVLPFRRD